MTNYWNENKLSIFGDATFNQKNLEHLSYFEENWNKNDETNTGIGKIELINGIPVSGKTTIYLDNPMIIISGWALDMDGNQLDSTFLLVDDKPFIKFDNFQPRKDILENFDGKADLHSGWEIFFMSGYLENDCQSISIAGFNNDKNITLNQEIEICKNNMN